MSAATEAAAVISTASPALRNDEINLFGNVAHRVRVNSDRQDDEAMLRPQLLYNSRWFTQLCSLL